MTISLTERAAKHVSGFLAKRGKGIGLRVGDRLVATAGSFLRPGDRIRPIETND